MKLPVTFLVDLTVSSVNSTGINLKNSNESYNEKLKRNQEKLKERAEELLSHSPDGDESQFIGNPDKIFEEDEDDKESLRNYS